MPRLLLVDDDHALRRVLRLALERFGYEVEEAEDGDDALRRVATARPDMVITDILMPNREGFEMIAQLRREAPDMPIVAMSGGGRSLPPERLADDARRLGATTSLVKPFPLEELRAAVELCLRRPSPP